MDRPGRGHRPVSAQRIAVACLVALQLACAHDPASPSVTTVTTTPPDWTKGAVCYEVFVRSFYDSNGDGIGDLNGLIQKLDYINDGGTGAGRDLGARCIWLMPVMPSPSYHGYDITDYYSVNPQYGTNDDFKRLVAEAHRRGIRVLVDMVLNHSSSEHPAFRAALADTASPYRAWYRFSPDANQLGPWGQEVWHRSPVRAEYYYGVFYYTMPDLNYANVSTRNEARKIAAFWLGDMGVDGFRLDAVPYLIEDGNQLRDTQGTHTFLREYEAYLKSVKPDAFTVGEVWDATSLMLTYYPDQLDSNFAFEASDNLIKAVATGSGGNLFTAYKLLQATLPGNRYSPFQRNHDETRTLTALGGDVARARVSATLLLTLPGLPFVYYGEEIGMTGDKPDERIRTPMQWNGAANAGFTTGSPWEALQPDWTQATVAAEDPDTASLLNLYRRLIHLRSANSALGMGELVPLSTGNDAVVAFLRKDASGAVLVVANLGSGALDGAKVTSADGALPAGQYTPTSLLGGTGGQPLTVGSNGRVQDYVPVATLAPRAARVFQVYTAAK